MKSTRSNGDPILSPRFHSVLFGLFVDDLVAMGAASNGSSSSLQPQMRLKVLALCGFAQNSNIYFKQVCGRLDNLTTDQQLGAIRKACKSVDFSQFGVIQSCISYTAAFLDPPHVLQKADMPWEAASMSDFATDAVIEEEVQTPETTPRGWWVSQKDRTVYGSEYFLISQETRFSSFTRLGSHRQALEVCLTERFPPPS